MNAKLIDRSAFVLALLVGVAYLALGSSLVLAIPAAALVYTLKVVLDLPAWRRRPRTPAPLAGSSEALWLERAEMAVASIRELRRSAHSEAVSQRCAAVAMQADLSLSALRRLAYQASVVSALTHSRDISGAVTSVAARQETSARLDSTRREQQARIEHSVLGLEGVVARLAEIVAISDGGTSDVPVEDLVFELDALRGALVDTEAIGRTSLQALADPNDERKVT